jgi:hypothetical protein
VSFFVQLDENDTQVAETDQQASGQYWSTTMPTNTLHQIPEITSDDPLNLIVERYPQTLAVLQHFGLDTCCGGALPLQTAAQHHALDLAEVLATLRAAAERATR